MKNAIHMLVPPTQHRQMNAFLITTADGKRILVDGGYTDDAEYLLSYLQQETQSERPYVDVWILTHAHRDHVGAFLEILQNRPDAISFGSVWFKFPSIQFFAREEGERDADAEQMLSSFYKLLPRFADRVQILTAGDCYDVGEAHIEILYTSNDFIVTNISNNASVVFCLTLGGRRALFTADAGVEAGQEMLLRYAGTDRLQCEICQMAHHGQNGCDRAFYEAVHPRICLWCAPEWLWNNDRGKGFDTHYFKTVKVRGWMEALGVTEHLVAKDGTQVLEL